LPFFLHLHSRTKKLRPAEQFDGPVSGAVARYTGKTSTSKYRPSAHINPVTRKMWRCSGDKGAHPDFEVWEGQATLVCLSSFAKRRICSLSAETTTFDSEQPKEANPNGAIARTASFPAGRSMPS
jgi:hypothetical protein